MKRMARAKIVVTLVLVGIIIFGLGIAQEIPQRPVPPKLVNDFSDILTKNQETSLENTLVEFANSTSTQIVIVTVKSLEGYDISDYAFRIGEEWGVGQSDKDNGIVIVVKPKMLIRQCAI